MVDNYDLVLLVLKFTVSIHGLTDSWTYRDVHVDNINHWIMSEGRRRRVTQGTVRAGVTFTLRCVSKITWEVHTQRNIYMIIEERKNESRKALKIYIFSYYIFG